MATPLEIMPLIYMLKALAVENKMPAVSLYGYALGAANIINALDFLTKQDEGTWNRNTRLHCLTSSAF